ncbi:LacI family DNA-binding transcriptional regulator [Rhizobium sp. CF142]|uniref:LacI family DNA-binding transcriptional regulator n=1 Tax=Rhizobium sp. CF142 TaxID=1144314 RepID=UPI00026EF6A3|nr:LacI family DNA-binding transcriptional regulator [Rhizobium sp. CF142]EJJ27121.1 transcriptional regulator [Rhizobium sp. CF142]
MNRPRLKDIALLTGFSTNTVSLALRGSSLVTDETRQLIEEAAAKVSYRPNEIAKSLVQRQSRSIGLVLTNITNPILTHTAQAIETMLSQRGYSTLFATSDNKVENEITALDAFQGRRVDGILIFPADHLQLAHIERLKNFHLPTVLLASAPGATLDVVSIKERDGARDATRHLIQLGHTRIGIIDSGHWMGNAQKLQGYLDALAEAGIERDDTLIVKKSGYSPNLGREAMVELMAAEAPPTAVFASNDAFAFGVLDWCRSSDLSVPDDLSVIGFDNVEFSAYAATPLTTVGCDPRELAGLAVERLLYLIEQNGAETAPLTQQIDLEIVVRKSTGPKVRIQ